MNCPYCHRRISTKSVARALAAKGGKSKSDLKVAAARANGAKGGRPRKQK